MFLFCFFFNSLLQKCMIFTVSSQTNKKKVNFGQLTKILLNKNFNP